MAEYATPEVSRQIFDDIVENGIKPHAHALAKILLRGDVAVVVYDPEPGEAVDAAHWLGWNGETNCFRITTSKRKRYADILAAIGDHVAARWLRGKRPGRIFVITSRATFLFNFEPGVGYALEVGSNAARAVA